MESKTIVLQIGASILLLLASFLLIYLGIEKKEVVMWILGASLALIAVIRLIIFLNVFLKRDE